MGLMSQRQFKDFLWSGELKRKKNPKNKKTWEALGMEEEKVNSHQNKSFFEVNKSFPYELPWKQRCESGNEFAFENVLFTPDTLLDKYKVGVNMYWLGGVQNQIFKQTIEEWLKCDMSLFPLEILEVLYGGTICFYLMLQMSVSGWVAKWDFSFLSLVSDRLSLMALRNKYWLVFLQSFVKMLKGK